MGAALGVGYLGMGKVDTIGGATSWSAVSSDTPVIVGSVLAAFFYTDGLASEVAGCSFIFVVSDEDATG